MTLEYEDYDDGPPPDWRWNTRERWMVIGPGFSTGIVLTALWCLVEQPGSASDRAWALGLIVGGPISGLVYGVACGCTPFVLLLSPAILAHPIRPNLWTGLATVVALALWFFSGWATVLVMTWGA
jgi:hypothetical protein